MKAIFPIIAVSLAGCAIFSGQTDPAERRVTYQCNYGPGLTVVFKGPTATIESPDGNVTLQQRRSASGFWYESATHSLRGQGTQISYKDRQMAPRECRAAS